ncbi:hypothetical protein [Isoalcanivorax indicus]|uniref:hypothetical protein n=1 Tax=Isoalcanivorax indicus TaxID=2202653 RepID=UPI001B86EB19|nr:hypothetical protein [Isoalcanivorax indicus]
MQSDAERIRLKLPEQDLTALTLGHAQPRKLQAWVEQLPLMNMGETSRQLYQYIQELNRLRIDTRTRFQLLEILRPVLLHVTDSLGKHYLRQSLVLPEKARRVASLAQALQGHLANGYKLVIARGLRKAEDREVRDALAIALHRAITAMGDTLLRCYQLYFPTPRHVWLELHQLFLLAERHELEDRVVSDPLLSEGAADTTVAQAYIRSLLLATAKPNQLRQQELATVYALARAGAVLVDVRSAAGEDDLFVFDLQVDRPPTYRTHVSVARGSCRYIDAQRLVAELGRDGSEGAAVLARPAGLSESLTVHLRQAWGALTERTFSRVAQRVSLDICFGLGALHHFSSEGADFATQIGAARLRVLEGDGSNPFSGQVRRASSAGMQPSLREEDPWSQAPDAGDYRMADSTDIESIDLSGITAAVQARQGDGGRVAFTSHRCETVNVSPGGYCLAWEGETPPQLRTGELVGVREQDHHEWTVGVVRWVKQLSHQAAQFGLELLAPRALPAAARVLKKTGDPSEFMRVLVLPALQAIGQDATLLVPAVGFHSNARLEIIRQGVTERVLLTRRLTGTASFSQFEFRGQEQSQRGGAGQDDAAGDDFKSIWSSL